MKIRKCIIEHAQVIKFTISSMVSALVDLGLFEILTRVFAWFKIAIPQIFVATVVARIASSVLNFCLNRKFSFESKGVAGIEAVKYGVLFVGKMCASGYLVTILSWIALPNVILKALVDTALFFVSYVVQKKWVFA
ncbi:MAG: GtrA family protein [Lachnospiraceae bacterium]